MDNTVSSTQPHSPLEDWEPALRGTMLTGSLIWVTNEENLIVFSTPDVASAAGVPYSSYFGTDARSVADQIVEPILEHRNERRERLFREGGHDTITLWAQRSDLGWTEAIVTSTRITHPENGNHYLLHVGHDVTDIQAQLEYLRARAFQGLIMTIVEKDGTVLAATDAAAKFCNPELTRGDQLRGATIDQTQWVALKEREAEQLELSRLSEKPAHAIEWLLAANNDYRPYAVARITFPKGRWMIVMMPVPLTEPFMQLDSIKDVLKANVNQPPKLNKLDFETLVDLYNKIKREVLAKRDGISVDGVDARRRRVVDRLGVDSVDDLLPAIRHTELGYLVQLYADKVCQTGQDYERT